MSDSQFWFKIAGFLTSIALILEAYGAHGLVKKLKNEKLVSVFRVGSKHHMLHSMALFFVPFSNHPNLTASLFIVGMIIFSSSLYFYALLNEPRFGKISPIGGTLLIIGWLTFCF